MRRWKVRPEGANWGDFGDEDQVGRLNLITPERRLAAMREVREGIAFPLSMPLDYPRGVGVTPFRHPPLLAPTAAYNQTFTPNSHDVFCDDKATICLQYSTQWDALSHVGALFDADQDGTPERVYYNGYRAEGISSAIATGTPTLSRWASSGWQRHACRVGECWSTCAACMATVMWRSAMMS